MKYTPRRSSKKAKKYHEAVRDYFPMKPNDQEELMRNKILTYLTRPSRGVKLTEEEQGHLFRIKSNIESGAYG